MNENTYHIGSRWIININHHSVDNCGLWQEKGCYIDCQHSSWWKDTGFVE